MIFSWRNLHLRTTLRSRSGGQLTFHCLSAFAELRCGSCHGSRRGTGGSGSGLRSCDSRRHAYLKVVTPSRETPECNIEGLLENDADRVPKMRQLLEAETMSVEFTGLIYVGAFINVRSPIPLLLSEWYIGIDLVLYYNTILPANSLIENGPLAPSFSQKYSVQDYKDRICKTLRPWFFIQALPGQYIFLYGRPASTRSHRPVL